MTSNQSNCLYHQRPASGSNASATPTLVIQIFSQRRAYSNVIGAGDDSDYTRNNNAHGERSGSVRRNVISKAYRGVRGFIRYNTIDHRRGRWRSAADAQIRVARLPGAGVTTYVRVQYLSLVKRVISNRPWGSASYVIDNRAGALRRLLNNARITRSKLKQTSNN